MSEKEKINTLKDIVLREDAASEEVKQNEIAVLRNKIEEKNRKIEYLEERNRRKKTAVIWLSILLGLVVVALCSVLIFAYTNNYRFSTDEISDDMQTSTETTVEQDQIENLANNNDDKAQLAMGQRYYSGADGYKQDKQQALEWFTRSANNGNTDAMKLLAVMYETGEGTEKNNQSAFKYYFMAARQGDKESLYKVGKCYYYGVAVDKNTEKALIYLDKAAAQSYQPAIALIDIIKQEEQSAHQQPEVKQSSETSTTSD